MTWENEGDLRVWWIPQVPGKPFYVPVSSLEQANHTLETLALYDGFQFSNNIKSDYCNVGGLEVFEDGEWCDWHEEETGDDFEEYRSQNFGEVFELDYQQEIFSKMG